MTRKLACDMFTHSRKLFRYLSGLSFESKASGSQKSANRYFSGSGHNIRPAKERHRVVLLPETAPALKVNVKDKNAVIELGVWIGAQFILTANEVGRCRDQI